MCYLCLKIAEGETSLVKKKYQNPRIILHKIAQKMIEKTSMIDIAHQLFISNVFKTFLTGQKENCQRSSITLFQRQIGSN